jgi:hypothetical protein
MARDIYRLQGIPITEGEDNPRLHSGPTRPDRGETRSAKAHSRIMALWSESKRWVLIGH